MDSKQVREEISRRLSDVQDAGFSDLVPVLRHILFKANFNIDWVEVKEEYLKHNPEVNSNDY